MKLRALGVALLASCGLALAVLPASVANAVDDPSVQTSPVTIGDADPGSTSGQPVSTDNAPLAAQQFGPDPGLGGPGGPGGPSGPGAPLVGLYPPSAACGGTAGSLGLGSSVAGVGSDVAFTGCGFVPGATVLIAVDGIAVGSVVADPNGDINGTAPVETAGADMFTATGDGVQTYEEPSDGILDKPIFDDKDKKKDDYHPAEPPVTRVVSGSLNGVNGVVGDPSDPSYSGDGNDNDRNRNRNNNTIIIPIPIPIPIDGAFNDKDNCNILGRDGRDGVLDGKDGKDGKDGRDGRDGNCIGGVGVGVVGVGVGAGGVGGVGGAGGATPAGSTLPFTGIETGAMASIALALLGGGLVLRVAARRRRNTLGAHTEG